MTIKHLFFLSIVLYLLVSNYRQDAEIRLLQQENEEQTMFIMTIQSQINSYGVK